MTDSRSQSNVGSRARSKPAVRPADPAGELDAAARRRVRIGGLIAAILTSLLISASVLAPPLAVVSKTDEAAAPGLPASQWLWDLFQRLSPGEISDRVQV